MTPKFDQLVNECTINSNEHGLIWEAYTSKKE